MIFRTCSLSIATWLLLLCCSSVHAQLVDDMEDETRLYAQAKQVNQFFRRFNGEEDEKGKRHYPGDKNYRNVKLRKKYMTILFDESNAGIGSTLKNEFAKDVTDNSEAAILNFHGGNWFAEVQATFGLNGKDETITLFMQLEKAQLGTKWVIFKVHADAFNPFFARDTVKVGRFLHPMSHELFFMNLRKAFSNKDSVSQFTSKRFKPDHLSVFLHEIRKGNLKFKTVNDVKFHFFQIQGWYFEIAEFNRPGYNTGWLISNLVKLKNNSEKELLQRHLFYETK